MSSTRPLTERERALISAVLTRLDPDIATALSAQLAIATALSGDVATILDITVPDRASPARVEDGPLPVRALVASDAGEIIVWAAAGRLSGLEFAWITDDPPSGWPPPDELDLRAG